MTRAMGRRLVWVLMIALIAAGHLAAVDVHVDEELDTESTAVAGGCESGVQSSPSWRS